MEELRNLQDVYASTADKFALYEGRDIILPQIFKEQVTEINSNVITYNKYSAIIKTRGVQNGVLNIFMPNQWFFIASYFTDFYNELQKYRSIALSVVSKDRLKELNGGHLSEREMSNINNLDFNEISKSYLVRFITDYAWWCGAKTIDRGDFYVSPILNCAKLVNSTQSFVADLCAFLSDKEDLVRAIITEGGNIIANNVVNQRNNAAINDGNRSLLTALRTKPFMLLAGISGTGKSRIVRELAKSCWKDGDEEYSKNNPRNFCMVQVKPNWHDSSELIGYVSRINGEKYVVGPFLKFMAKAINEPDKPYFLCLDEMNLAPVEQYFAEYLSVIESRKLNADGSITTDPIIDFEPTDAYKSLIDQLFPDDDATREEYLKENNGKRLTIPQNLFVVGTVNMDETTFSFSRKVLDRAMTIEMNEVDLHGGLTDGESEIGYIGNCIIGNAAEGKDVYADNQELCDKVLEYLGKVNAVLEGTPFKIAYRTRNEFLMYAVNRQLLDDKSQLWQTLDEMTSMKILSRIEGDSERTQGVLGSLKNLMENEIAAKIPEPEEGKAKAKSISAAKIEEMLGKLNKSGYTSYWA